MRHRLATYLAHVLAALILFSASSRADGRLYDSLGGRQGVDRIAEAAISLYMSDPRLHAYFDNINPDWLEQHFAVFICHVTDGPCAYHGRSMAASHRGLHIDEAAFDAVVEDLQAAMRKQNIPFWTQNRLLARLAPMERDIVTR